MEGFFLQEICLGDISSPCKKIIKLSKRKNALTLYGVVEQRSTKGIAI